MLAHVKRFFVDSLVVACSLVDRAYHVCMVCLLSRSRQGSVLSAVVCIYHQGKGAWLCRLSYVEGRLKLAEKERQRAQKAKGAAPEDGVSQEELDALNAKADANMAALLQEEAALKVSPWQHRSPALSLKALDAFRVWTRVQLCSCFEDAVSVIEDVRDRTDACTARVLCRMLRKPRKARRKSARARRAKTRDKKNRHLLPGQQSAAALKIAGTMQVHGQLQLQKRAALRHKLQANLPGKGARHCCTVLRKPRSIVLIPPVRTPKQLQTITA